MTQPPQPPNEPPQGGFGAPQDPPPGGFGAPVPPPADPFGKQPVTPPAGGFGPPQEQPPAGGFGAPQTPPAGPPQQPGYGYPQQPGYGYPPGPPAGQGLPPGQPPQQGYGYGYPTAPMQPQYAPPQQGGNGGKKFTTQMQIIVAAVVAVAVIIGGGIFLASGGDDKKNEVSSAGPTGGDKGGEDSGIGGGGKEKVPANTKSTVAFQLSEPKVGDVTTVDGSWLTDKAYVKTGVDEIVGYDKAKGTKLWSIPLEGQLCAASRHMSKDYKTAIVFEEGKPTKAKKYPPCNQVGGIDLNTGKLMWSKPVTAATSGDEPVRFDEVTVSGSTVAAGGTEGGAAFDLNTGAERWKPKVGTDGCYDKGYGGGDALAVVRKCGTYDSPQLVIQALNPTTGAPLSSFKMPPGVDYASIVSTKPLVVAADVGDTAGDGSGISDFFSIDASTGKLLTKIAADGEKYAARCGSTEVETCQQLAVGNNRLYLPTEEHEGTGEYGDTNEIVSFDLTTGKPTSDKADAGDRYTMFPIRMDGSNIIAYKVPPYDKGGQIVSIDGSTFKQTVLMENPGDESVRDAETSFSMDYAEILYSDGRMYISEVMVSKPRESSLDDKQYLAVSFATG
ncbi:PQQ-binding-like beta-propeller repeat protein [Streptomyces sp. NBC_00121]|uniref:outer membrane protein assembly factor BamB family protein n=1 Tax=unclassified Streptomyces TaxID=2593676 RepID=UPI002DDC2123|nr:PQQ-binding-like beta-propeller repeat protein [Streptomyces sp. NBC_01760]WSC69900.1 PQQ-binding-like beta-propeller repeat protein [Streptomyces sp. NBC_01760]